MVTVTHYPTGFGDTRPRRYILGAFLKEEVAIRETVEFMHSNFKDMRGANKGEPLNVETWEDLEKLACNWIDGFWKTTLHGCLRVSHKKYNIT